MAISVNGGGNGGGKRRFHGSAALSEINVTPFVDVVLVLLIIFMLTAHVIESGIEVDVPKTKQTQKGPQDLPVVTVSKTGEYTFNGKAININQIKEVIRQKYGTKQAIYVRADKDTVWDAVAQVTAELGAAGFKVNMVTQPLDESSRGR